MQEENKKYLRPVVDKQKIYDRIRLENAMTEPSADRDLSARGDGASPQDSRRAGHSAGGPGRPGRPIPVTGWHETPPFFAGGNQGGTVEFSAPGREPGAVFM